jgi:hypothetical protein
MSFKSSKTAYSSFGNDCVLANEVFALRQSSIRMGKGDIPLLATFTGVLPKVGRIITNYSSRSSSLRTLLERCKRRQEEVRTRIRFKIVGVS